MLAYRHAFHAGNHGDVLKHVVLVQVLRYMAEKDKPYTLVDTHAGAGTYALGSREARLRGEYRDGIGRLWQAGELPPALAEYVEVVRRANAGGALRRYPGSPDIARLLMRDDDRLALHEMHPSDFRQLAHAMRDRRHTTVDPNDGFAALAAKLPPPSRRGVVLVDPSYEIKADYARTVAALRTALQRFATGTVVVWYPKLAIVESTQMPRRLLAAAAAAPKGWLHATLSVAAPDPGGFGMTGSGVVVANPPWRLQAALAAALPVLVTRLGRFPGARFSLDVHAGH